MSGMFQGSCLAILARHSSRHSHCAHPDQEVLDGGRLITGGESFDLKTIPGQDMLLVGRFLGQGLVALQVWVNGRPVGPWGYGAIPGRWQERALSIPAAYITGTRTRIEITADSSRPGFEFHVGMYDAATGGRLPIERGDGANRLQLLKVPTR